MGRNLRLKTLITRQNKAVRIINSSSYRNHAEPIFKTLSLLKITDLYQYSITKLMFKVMGGVVPTILSDMFPANYEIHNYLTRQQHMLHVPICRTTLMARTFQHKGVQSWNYFHDKVDGNCNFHTYKKRLKHFLLKQYNE